MVALGVICLGTLLTIVRRNASDCEAAGRGTMIAAIIIGLTRFLVGGTGLWLGCGPSARQRIYFANHSSHLDTIILWAAHASGC